MSNPKSLADIIRSIKVGKSKRIEGHTPNVVRVTASRVLGTGNYSVTTQASDVVTVHNLSYNSTGEQA
jgi:hypothetical protein